MTVLERLSGLDANLFIEGALRRSETSETFDSIDPATESILGQIANATEAEVDEAVAAANRAQKIWAKENAMTRAEALHEVAAKLRALSPILAEALTREMGKPYKESVDEVAWTAGAFDHYAETARNEAGRVLAANVDGQFHFTLKEPLGTVVIVLTCNYPYVLFAWQAAAALAAGNAVILKPSPSADARCRGQDESWASRDSSSSATPKWS